MMSFMMKLYMFYPIFYYPLLSQIVLLTDLVIYYNLQHSIVFFHSTKGLFINASTFTEETLSTLSFENNAHIFQRAHSNLFEYTNQGKRVIQERLNFKFSTRNS